MTDKSATGRDAIRWGVRVAIVGLIIAVLTATVGILGVGLPDPVFWIGILVSFGGIVVAAALLSRSSSLGYGGGVGSTVVGVLVIAYGMENGSLLATIVGILLVIVGAVVVVADGRRLEEDR